MLQTEAAECGLACLAMVANYHGHHTTLQALRGRFNISIKGVSLLDLIGMAQSLGLSARPLRLELNELKELKTPCILHWDLNHFVVLEDRHGDTVTIHDPASGRRRLAIKEVSHHFTGVALELAPDAAFERNEAQPRIRLRDVVGKTYGLRQSLTQILVISLVLEALALAAPLMPQLVVDQVLLAQDTNLLVVLVIGFALVLLCQIAVGVVRSWALIYMSTQFSLQWSSSVFAHLVRLPLAYFERRHVGDVQSRFGAIGQIQGAITNQALSVVLDGLMALAALVMLAIYYAPLAAVAGVSAALYLALRLGFYEPLRDVTEAQIVHGAKASSHFLESLRGMQSIRLYGAEVLRHTRWMNLLVEQFNAGVKSQKYLLGFTSLNQAIFGLEGMVVLAVGANAVMGKTVSIGMLFAALAYKDQFSKRMASLIDVWFSLRLMQIQSERLADIVFTEREAPEAEKAPLRLPKGPVGLEAHDLRFSYSDNERPIIKDCSFSIAQGECVAIAGPSGCGKTTLLKLLVGLHAPDNGHLSIGGQRLQRNSLASYRESIGTVMQDDHLFSGNIIENITFFGETVDMDRVVECAKMAAIHDEIDAMPMGYHTLLGDMGTSVSGGQRQRILLARALYKRPRILFLDEATSHLDVANEERVNQSIRALKITRVIIAHRPSTLALADRVLHMEGGKMHESAPPRCFSSSTHAALSVG